MTRRISIDPITRLEGHGKIEIFLDDEGAVEALQPDRVLLLPDGDEDLWSPEYADLISLA